MEKASEEHHARLVPAEGDHRILTLGTKYGEVLIGSVEAAREPHMELEAADTEIGHLVGEEVEVEMLQLHLPALLDLHLVLTGLLQCVKLHGGAGAAVLKLDLAAHPDPIRKAELEIESEALLVEAILEVRVALLGEVILVIDGAIPRQGQAIQQILPPDAGPWEDPLLLDPLLCHRISASEEREDDAGDDDFGDCSHIYFRIDNIKGVKPPPQWGKSTK